MRETLCQSYNADERRAHKVALSASFVYDGDGNRVQSYIGGVTTTFVGNYYETDGITVTKYYGVYPAASGAGSQRIAMSVDGSVYYLLSDQLGSTSITTNSSGGYVSELRYTAWGGVRFTSGTTPTDYTYTGQYSNVDDFGLMYYNARWYDSTIARFAQADTIVPDGVQGYDRYAYVSNNPVRYGDPSGHCVDVDAGLCVHEDQASGGLHIVHPGQGRFANCVETVIADAILSWNYGGLDSVQGGAPFMIGAAIEYACMGLGVDCGNYYQQVFWRMAAGLSGISGSYPPVGTGPGWYPNTIIPTNIVSDVYSGGGWVTDPAYPTANPVMVLGRYGVSPSYLDVAQDVGGTAFNIPQAEWDSMTPAERWAANQAALDQAISEHAQFYLAHGWNKAVPGSTFRTEPEYLFDRGFTLSPGQKWLIPPVGY